MRRWNVTNAMQICIDINKIQGSICQKLKFMHYNYYLVANSLSESWIYWYLASSRSFSVTKVYYSTTLNATFSLDISYNLVATW